MKLGDITLFRKEYTEEVAKNKKKKRNEMKWKTLNEIKCTRYDTQIIKYSYTSTTSTTNIRNEKLKTKNKKKIELSMTNAKQIIRITIMIIIFFNVILI